MTDIAALEEDAGAWLWGRLPKGWFTERPDVTADRDELVVVGTLELPPVDGGEATRASVEAGRIKQFREETREKRIAIAKEAERRYGRTISWGARAGETTELFTTASVPVMTRLRQPERQVLDTLVDAGVARSRSEALAWCVRLVGEHADTWLTELREAMGAVDRLRAQGPDVAGAGEPEATES
jgi:hypothetical protein